VNVDYVYLSQSNENWTAMIHLLIKCLARTKIWSLFTPSRTFWKITGLTCLPVTLCSQVIGRPSVPSIS